MDSPVSVTEVDDDILMIELSSSDLGGDMDVAVTTVPFEPAAPAPLTMEGNSDPPAPLTMEVNVDDLKQRHALLQKDVFALNTDMVQLLKELKALQSSVQTMGPRHMAQSSECESVQGKPQCCTLM